MIVFMYPRVREVGGWTVHAFGCFAAGSACCGIVPGQPCSPWSQARSKPDPPHICPPQANTSGCTKQAQGFKARYQELKDAGFEVYGLSFDNPTAQTKWKTKLDLPYSLLTDDSGDVSTGHPCLGIPGFWRSSPCRCWPDTPTCPALFSNPPLVPPPRSF